MLKKLKKFIKIFIDYRITEEERVYTLKHTPLRVKRCYTQFYHRELEDLPIVQNKVVFDNYMGSGYGCNGKYVLQRLLESGIASDKKLDLVWTVKDVKGHRNQFPSEIRLVEYGSAEAMREYATAKVWVQNYQMVHYLNQGLKKKKGQYYIQMWHGSFGIKKIENNCNILQQDQNWLTLARWNSESTDYWISNSDFETEVYRNAFWKVKNVLEYGHPRNDIFFAEDKEERCKKIRHNLGLGEEKLLLYVPTFRDDTMKVRQPLDIPLLLGSLRERFGGEWKFLLRAHPRIKQFEDTSVMDSDEVMEVTGYPDIQELLLAADAVITDYSSAVFDFMLSRKPAFLYIDDVDRYRQVRGLYYPVEETPFPIAGSNEELSEKILGFDEESYKKAVDAFLEGKGSKEEGQASQRVAELIEDLIRKES